LRTPILREVHVFPVGLAVIGRSKPAMQGRLRSLQNQPVSTLGSGGRPSQCEPFRKRIEGWLEQGLSAQRILQDLRDLHGFKGSYSSVKRFVRRMIRKRPLPFRRLECGPGEEAQVDLGFGPWLQEAGGKRRRSYVFRMVLSHSRKGYSEAVTKQSLEFFIRAMENSFHAFGGIPSS
jgi:transposase